MKPLKKIITAYILTGSVLFISFGCDTKKSTESHEISEKMKRKPIQTEELKKLSITQANAAYGAPLETDRFNMKGGVVEFRMELYELYDDNDDVELFEATWSKNEKNNITVWYVEKNNDWFPVHTMEWEKGLEF